MQNPIIARTWLFMAILDLIYYYCILIRFKSMMGKVVICDRYLVDTYIDFSLNFINIAFEKMFLWRILMKFHKKPSLSFLFTLEAQESIRRSKIKDEPFPDSKDIINKRLEHYQNLDLKFADNWVVIDGLDNIESSKKIINKKTFELLKNKYAS